MSEKEKMLAGELYWAYDEELVQMRLRARELTLSFNNSGPAEIPLRTEILKQLFGQVVGNIYIEPTFRCDYGSFIYAGENLYMNFGCVILDCAPVHFGNNILLGPNVQIYAASHPLDPAERLTGKELAFPVTIGDNVWIGGGAIICAGVSIGANTTIGAGSVVIKDIPANVLAAGNPCRVIREVKAPATLA
jgi:maltose O-acetyltransferase